ncbi:MAG: carbohydrate ABC transporter permease [Clostridiaceae bacterium]|nr:carbohydrate ABC transporter permease [Clostridiaceae bacterium]
MAKKGIRTNARSDVMFYFLVYLLTALAFFITLYPFIYIVSVSISDPIAVQKGQVFLWPVGFSVEGYANIFRQPTLWSSYGNTIFYTVVGTLFNMIATVMTAYPLSRRTFCARKFFNFFIVFVMYFNGGLIPTYLLVTKLGFYNSRWVMIIPCLLSSYNVMVCRSAFSAVPEEVMESAQIDGANDIQILLRIAVRLITPTLAVLTLYYAVANWNNFFTALLYLTKAELQPLTILLRRIVISASTEFMSNVEKSEARALASIQIRYACIVTATLPILTIYPFLQKYFVKGVMLGAVKG